jgi:FMN phosphatase YigB (HAD superfamily)
MKRHHSRIAAAISTSPLSQRIVLRDTTPQHVWSPYWYVHLVPISTDAIRRHGLRPVRAVLFDFAETLFFPEEMPQRIRGGLFLLGNGRASGPEIDRIAEEIESAFESEDYLATKERRDLSAANHRAAFTAAFSAAEGMFEGLADAMYDRLTDPASWTPFPDVKPTLGSLHQHGVRVGVVSNIGFDIRPIFSHHGLTDFFEAFSLSFEHGIIKPDPALFEIAMHALDVGPAETVMVGDNVADSGAVLAGARVYLLPPVVSGTERGLAEILAICKPLPRPGLT